VEHLCADLRIPPLRQYGIATHDFPALIEKAAKASSMKANPIPLTSDEMRQILDRAF
jgi:alcohol dehydrogenase class IV